MTIDGQKVKVGVNIRPYAMTFLKKMAKQFEIVIFTASH
jgi:TFIIF-interacting CTD phosphatase-like protein